MNKNELICVPSCFALSSDLFSASERIITADMHDIPFEDCTFDAVISIHCQEHSFDPSKSTQYILNDSYNNISADESCENGFIQMGNVLNSNGILPWEQISLNNYPIPTLTLLGTSSAKICTSATFL